MGFTYTYKGIEHEVEDDSKRLTTRGKYLEDDITIEAQGGGNIVPLTIAGNVTYNTDSVGWMTPISFAPLCNVDNSNKNPLEFDIVIKTGSNVSTTQYIIGGSGTHGDQSSHRYQFAVCIQSGGLWIGNNLNGYGSSRATISANTEYHINIVLESGYRCLYVNGTKVWQAAGASQVDSDVEMVALFANYDNLTGTLSGRFLGEAQSVALSSIADAKFIFLKDGYLRNGVFNSYPAGSVSFRSVAADGFAPVTAAVEGRLYGLPTSAFTATSNIDLGELDFSSVTAFPKYAFYYRFQNIGKNLRDIIYNGAALPNYVFYYAFYGVSGGGGHVDIIMPNLTSVETYAMYYAFYYGSNSQGNKMRDILIGDSNKTMTVKSYAFGNMCYAYNRLRDVVIRGVKSITESNAFAGAFRAYGAADTCSIDGRMEFPDLETINSTYVLNYVFASRRIAVAEAKVINPFPKLTTLTGGYSFGNAFSAVKTHQNSVFVFPKLKTLGNSNSSNAASSMFASASGNFKYIWFNALETMGYSGTSCYSIMSSAFNFTAYTANCYQVCFPALTSIISTSTSTSASYGTFYSCKASKVWLPMLQSVNGTPNTTNMFANSTSAGMEIHFGKENEAYIKSLAGYASKFGATNATIFFDCINHITVGGTVYDRDGADYIVGVTNETNATTHEFTHPNDRYAWKNGTTVIYTLEAWTPAVGDTVYDADDVQIGTISAVS